MVSETSAGPNLLHIEIECCSADEVVKSENDERRTSFEAQRLFLYWPVNLFIGE